jgi:hypothetical protein
MALYLGFVPTQIWNVPCTPHRTAPHERRTVLGLGDARPVHLLDPRRREPASARLG